MFRSLFLGILFALVILGVAAQPAAAQNGNCWGRLKAPLDKGGFYVGTDCSDYYSMNLRYLGRTRGPRKYRVYNAIWVLNSPAGGPGHGGDRLIIFDDHMKYLGYYRFDIPEGRKVWLKGSTVYVNGPASEGNKLSLVGRNLPEKSWLLGDNGELYK